MADAVKAIGEETWHGRLFVWSYSAFDQKPPSRFDLWLYVTTVAGALLFLVCAFVIFLVLNIGTIVLGVYVEPIWRTDARFRRLTFPGGIPIIGVAAPILLAIAAWDNWSTHGPVHTLGPFVVTAVMGFGLLGCFVLFNRMRRGFPRFSLRADGADTRVSHYEPAQTGSNTTH